LTFHLGVCP